MTIKKVLITQEHKTSHSKLRFIFFFALPFQEIGMIDVKSCLVPGQASTVLNSVSAV